MAAVSVLLFTYLIFPMYELATAELNTVEMSSQCGHGLTITSPILLRLTKGDKYLPSMNCSLQLQSSSEFRLIIGILWVDIDVKNDITCHDHVTIRDGHAQSALAGPLCRPDTLPYGSLTSTLSHATVEFHSDGLGEGRGFEMLVAPFHTGGCHQEEYECRRGRCILLDDSLLQCNDTYNYCGDDSDYCPESTLPEFYRSALPIVVSLALIGAVVLSVFLLMKEKLHKKKRIGPGSSRLQSTTTSSSCVQPSITEVPVPPDYTPPYSTSPPPPYDSIYPNKTIADSLEAETEHRTEGRQLPQ